MEAKLKTTQPKPNTKEDPKPMPKAVEPEIVEESEPMAEMPTELVVQDEKGQPITDSLTVAAVFGKEHYNVLKKIKGLKCSEKFRAVNFNVSSYAPEGASRSYDKVDMTFKGFSRLTMGFTGSRAAEFQEKYVDAFEDMRERLSKPTAPKSHLEVLVGVANGLLEQDKKLKEIEGKVLQADEKMGAVEEKVAELDHVFQTNGCAKGFMPLTDAHETFGRRFWGYIRATRVRGCTATSIVTSIGPL